MAVEIIQQMMIERDTESDEFFMVY